MAALTFGFFMTTFFNDHVRPVDIQVGKVSVKNVPDYSADRDKSDLGFITFDLYSDILLLVFSLSPSLRCVETV